MDLSRYDAAGLEQAQIIARVSTDPSTQTGCVILYNGRLIASGYNRIAIGLPRLAERTREERLARTVHAEANALLRAGTRAQGASAYVWPWPPCAPCALLLIHAGIRRVVAPAPTLEQRERWGQSWADAARLYAEAGVDFVEVFDGDRA